MRTHTLTHTEAPAPSPPPPPTHPDRFSMEGEGVGQHRQDNGDLQAGAGMQGTVHVFAGAAHACAETGARM
jgi:hypothetical protein